MIDAARKAGPTVVFDSGNALFKQPGLNDPKALERARFILRKYGALGVKAMAVGARDLNASAPWLQREADAAGVEVLSVNLVGPDSKPIFKGSTIVTEGELKLAFIGATAPGPHGEVTAHPPLPLVKAEADKLKGKADVLIVLAAMTYADALQLSNELKDSVDFIIQSHDNRGIAIAQKGPGNYLLPSGERGRHVARVDLEVGGKARFQDLGEYERDQQVIDILDRQLAEVQKRKKAAQSAEVKAELHKTEAEFQKRRKDLLAQQGGGKKSSRTFKLQFVGLAGDVKDDPEWKKEVDRIDPPGSRGH